MIKWLLFALFVFGIYYFFFRKSKSIKDEVSKNNKKSESIMLECTQCGTYVTSDECVIKDGKYYCSKDCARLK